MTNFELELKFENIFRLQDCFDSFLALKQLKKEYKKTDFYKQSHLPIEKAYSLYIKSKGIGILRFLTKLENSEEVGNLISDYIDHIDPDIIWGFFNKISEIFDPEQLKILQKQLNESYNKLKTE